MGVGAVCLVVKKRSPDTPIAEGEQLGVTCSFFVERAPGWSAVPSSVASMGGKVLLYLESMSVMEILLQS